MIIIFYIHSAVIVHIKPTVVTWPFDPYKTPIEEAWELSEENGQINGCRISQMFWIHDVIWQALMRTLLSGESTKKTGSHMMPCFILLALSEFCYCLLSLITFQIHSFQSQKYNSFFCETRNLNFSLFLMQSYWATYMDYSTTCRYNDTIFISRWTILNHCKDSWIAQVILPEISHKAVFLRQV